MMNTWFCQEDNPRVAQLQARLKTFYDTTRDYEAFAESNWKPDFWLPIRDAVQRLVAESGQCSVLEFGAGRTSFGEFLGPLRLSVKFDVQDVTDLNVEHLSRQADEVHLCSLREIHKRYDVIFSTFVWEHLTEPRASLNHLLSLLTDRGVLFLASPRYDFPCYLSPSIRHRLAVQRARVALWLLWRRLLTRFSRGADFLLHIDPAVFHRPWFRDADAIHWVSRWDLVCSVPDGWTVRDIRISSNGAWHWFWSRFLLLFVVIYRRERAAALGFSGRE